MLISLVTSGAALATAVAFAAMSSYLPIAISSNLMMIEERMRTANSENYLYTNHNEPNNDYQSSRLNYLTSSTSLASPLLSSSSAFASPSSSSSSLPPSSTQITGSIKTAASSYRRNNLLGSLPVSSTSSPSSSSSSLASKSPQALPTPLYLTNEKNASDSSSSSPPLSSSEILLVVVFDAGTDKPKSYTAENQSRIEVLNVTSEVPIEYANKMYGLIMPFLLIVTIIANSLVVIVLSQREMRTSTNLVLTAMAISDALTLLFPNPWYFYMYTLGNHSKLLYPPEACKAYVLMVEVLPAFFHTASIWLTLLLAGQRYIYVCHPTVAPKWCTIPKVCRAILLVFLASLLHQMPRYFERQYLPVTVYMQQVTNHSLPVNDPYSRHISSGDARHLTGQYDYNHTLAGQLPSVNVQKACWPIIQPWVSYIPYDSYFIFYYLFRIIFVNAGPCTALVILNLLLFRALRQAQDKRAKLFKENRRSECKRVCDTNCTTLMLIVVVSVFLATEIPLAITTILHVIMNTYHFPLANYDHLNMIILVTNFMMSASYPLNFAIYCGMSRQFRETFKALFISGSSSSSRREGSTRYSVANGPRTSTHETIL